MGSDDKKDRLKYNILTVLVYIIGIILIIQLFNLQIVKGEEFRKQSNTRLTRETVLKAARGNILDRTGKKLVSSYMTFGLELYKTKVDNSVLNDTILKIIYVLEKNGDTYNDNLPITVEPYAFTSDDDEYLKKWKNKNKINEDATAEDVFNLLKEKYEINSDNVHEARKIMTVRYEISQNGYSSTKGIQISDKLSRESVMELSERNSEFAGINIVTEPKISYTSENLASHILGTIGKITRG